MKAKNRLALIVEPEIRKSIEGLSDCEIGEVADELQRQVDLLRAHIGAAQGSQPRTAVLVRKPAARKPQRKRGAYRPFFKFRLQDFYDKGYRNMARCLGISHHQLFTYCLLGWAKDAERTIGLDVVEASKLTRRECDAIARRIRVAMDAVWSGGNSDNN